MNKLTIDLLKKEEGYIRKAIASELTSCANTTDYEYPHIQENIWDNELFDFDEKYFKHCTPVQKKDIAIAKNLFNKLRKNATMSQM